MPIKTFSTSDNIITWLFLLMVLVYTCTIILILVLPSLHVRSKFIKIALFAFSVFGGLALILKYAIDYDKFVVLGFLIFYAVVYAAAWIIIFYKKRQSDKLAQKLIDAKNNNGTQKH